MLAVGIQRGLEPQNQREGVPMHKKFTIEAGASEGKNFFNLTQLLMISHPGNYHIAVENTL